MLCPLDLRAGEEADFNMHLGTYGQAYFAAESSEVVDGEQLGARCASPASGAANLVLAPTLLQRPRQLRQQCPPPATPRHPPTTAAQTKTTPSWQR
jgi:hypothetical protein